MWTIAVTAAFAATIEASADAVKPCDPPSERCVTVTVDAAQRKHVKRRDALTVQLTIPEWALPPPPPPPVEAPKSTGLSEPWSGMGLPIGDGSLLYSDRQSMTLSYGGYSAPLHARDFDEALLAAGWTSTFQSDDGGMFSHVYSHNSETLTLSVVEAAGRTTLSITRY